MKNHNLYLDDWRIPVDSFKDTENQIYLSEDWKIVRTYNEFCNYIIDNGIPTIISFDHDLGDEHYKHQNNDLMLQYDSFKEKTGYHCAVWLIDYCIDNKLDVPKNVLIHSMSINGARNIKSVFKTYYKVYNIADYQEINDVDYDFVRRKFVYKYYN